MICEETFKLKEDGTPYSNCLCKTPELIENYNKAISDTTQIWECHHRMEAVYSRAEHNLLHKKGKSFSEEHKKKTCPC